jgi:hypothetical protein
VMNAAHLDGDEEFASLLCDAPLATASSSIATNKVVLLAGAVRVSGQLAPPCTSYR